MQAANCQQDEDYGYLSQLIDPDFPAICRLWAVRMIKGRRLTASIYESLVLEDVPAFLRKLSCCLENNAPLTN